MNAAKYGVLLIAVAASSGCVSMAKKETARELARACAAQGADRRIVASEPISRGGMFGTVVVNGDCLAPGEEGYEDAMTIEQYLESLNTPRT